MKMWLILEKGARIRFIGHLDLMRTMQRALRRSGLPVRYSNGFNPHMLIYLSSPIALGLKSTSEYCLLDTDYKGEDFKELFNKNSLKGIRLTDYYLVDKKLNIANDITSAIYEISGFEEFDTGKILNSDSFTVFDKRANADKEVRDRILDLYFSDGKLYAELKFGNVTLRPDYLIEKLAKTYSSNHPFAIKKDVKFLNGLSILEYLEQVSKR